LREIDVNGNVVVRAVVEQNVAILEAGVREA